MISTRDRFIGCLLGLAIGDSLGSRLEGYSPEAVKRTNIDAADFLAQLWQWSRGRWTDDTKMMLALAESIVEAKRFDPEAAARKYLEWYESGDWRGIGNVTQQSLANLKAGAGWQESGVTADWAAGNGTAMRVAPIGLLDCNDPERLGRDASDDAKITHNNHEAMQGSVAVAFAVAQLARDAIKPPDIIPATLDALHPSAVLTRLETAQRLFEQGTSVEDALADLGTGGYVVETVASSFYCLLASGGSFEAAVYHAIRGGNDTDTTAAVTGALCGASFGFEAIPLRWREEVEGASRIEALAGAIYELATGPAS